MLCGLTIADEVMLRPRGGWLQCCCCPAQPLRPRSLPSRPGFSGARSLASAAISSPTIYAPATGKGKSAIAILRISGDDALDVWRRMTVSPRTRKRIEADPPERKAVLRKIVHPETDEVLDEGVVLYFPRQSSSARWAGVGPFASAVD